jgi:hypothetical protein
MQQKRNKLFARALLLGGIVSCLVVASSARAQVLKSTKGYYYTGDICLGGEAAIANQPPQQYVSVYTQEVLSGCFVWKTVGAGRLGLKRALYKQVPGGWWKCRWTGWIYNTEPTSYIYRSRQWKRGAPCGSGYYQTRAWGKVYFNGQWHRGNRWSGRVWLVG